MRKQGKVRPGGEGGARGERGGGARWSRVQPAGPQPATRPRWHALSLLRQNPVQHSCCIGDCCVTNCCSRAPEKADAVGQRGAGSLHDKQEVPKQMGSFKAKPGVNFHGTC